MRYLLVTCHETYLNNALLFNTYQIICNQEANYVIKRIYSVMQTNCGGSIEELCEWDKEKEACYDQLHSVWDLGKVLLKIARAAPVKLLRFIRY